MTVINDYREEPEEAFWILYPMGVKCLSMITKSLLNTNRDFVTDCAFQLNILLIMTVKPKQVQPVSLLKIFNFEIFTSQFQSILLSSKEEEQKSPAIWTTFSVFYMGDL